VTTVQPVECSTQAPGWPVFKSTVDVHFIDNHGFEWWTWIEIRNHVADAQVAPAGMPNVVLRASATLVRWRFAWGIGWYEDGQTQVSCADTLLVA
jgi:hypothetical protein